MDERPAPKSLTGQTLILIVLLADVGLVILGWYYYQQRQTRYTSSGLNLASAPAAETVGTPATRTPGQDALRSASVVLSAQERALPGPTSQPPSAPAAAPQAGPGPGGADARTARLMDRSARHYFSVKNSPRFKASPVIAAWRGEFLSHPDLRAINARYRQDKDAIRFMYDALRSPNFQRMVRKYSSEPDVQAFLREVAASPAVLDASRSFLSRYNLGAAVKNLGLSLPGMDSPEGRKR